MSSPAEFSSDTYAPRYPAHEMDAARCSQLTASPISQAATEACQELLERLAAKVTTKQHKALGALIADLLERDPDDAGGWLYRSMDPTSFSGGPVGYRPFHTVYTSMIEATMIEEVRGNRVWTASEITNFQRQPLWQRATRFRAAPWLREWFADRGISRKNWSEHFQRDLSPPSATKGPCPLVLRTAKPPFRFGALKGLNLPVDKKDPAVAEMIARMDRINAYLASAAVAPFGPVVLRRIFAHGDDPSHGWQQGGRLYAIGNSPYQTAKREARQAITINGSPTCELDIQASHLTILAGLGHIPRFEGDPYAIDGLPRPVVKRWVNMTLSHGKRHIRWPKSAVEDLKKDHRIDLRADYPIRPTGDTILSHLPILKEDGSSSVAVGWGELQFRESEVVLSCMEVLAFEHDVPALPVHDSLLVPREAEGVAKMVLGQAFRDAVGIDAVIG